MMRILIALILFAGAASADPVLRFPNEFAYWSLWISCGQPA
jgi:hypothetical protein